MNDKQKIRSRIKAYAKAYSGLQKLQEESCLIPEGDQKTGCIGEFYSYIYLLSKFPKGKFKYGRHSEKGWDIEICHGKTRSRVQVKTVSAYSKKRTISPLHHGWDELHIIYLDREFCPAGFWIITDKSIVGKGEVKKGLKCREPGRDSTGSALLLFGDNEVDVQLLKNAAQ